MLAEVEELFESLSASEHRRMLEFLRWIREELREKSSSE